MSGQRMPADTFEDQLGRYASLVEDALEAALPAETTYPRTLHRAMRYGTLGGGKRVRAFLALTSCEAAGGETARALPVAAAIEMIHAYSLVHDDLPCMDDDDMRRGRPSCHKAFGEAVALLAGDALLTRAMETLAHLSQTAGVDAGRALQIAGEIATAAGSEGMIGGQVVDLLSEGRVSDPGAPDRLEYVHVSKTGALLRAAARAGALAGGASDEALEAISSFASHLGISFQIVDDILDETGNPSEMGKDVGRDRDRKKLTYPAVHGLEAARAEAARRTDVAEEAVRGVETLDSTAVDSLVALARFVLERTH